MEAEAFAYTLGLLTNGNPAIAPPVLGTLAIIGGTLLAVVTWAVAHLSLTLRIAADLLLAQTFPG